MWLPAETWTNHLFVLFAGIRDRPTRISLSTSLNSSFQERKPNTTIVKEEEEWYCVFF